MAVGEGLTWFLCGGVDGRRLWPRAARIECSHTEVVDCVSFQPRNVNQCVVSRYAHFANSVRLGVVFPVHDLFDEKKSQSWATANSLWCISLDFFNSYSIVKYETLYITEGN